MISGHDKDWVVGLWLKLRRGLKACWTVRSDEHDVESQHELIWDHTGGWLHVYERHGASTAGHELASSSSASAPSLFTGKSVKHRTVPRPGAVDLVRLPYDINGRNTEGASSDIIEWLVLQMCGTGTDDAVAEREIEEGLRERGVDDLLTIEKQVFPGSNPYGWSVTTARHRRLANDDEAVDPMPSNRYFGKTGQCGACGGQEVRCIHAYVFEHITGKAHRYEFLCQDCQTYTVFNYDD